MTTLEIVLLVIVILLFAALGYAARRVEELEERNEKNVEFLLSKMIDRQPPVYRYGGPVSVDRAMLGLTEHDRSITP